jgi:hypothetical protein
MKEKYILKRFVAFLKKNNVYNEFLYYLQKDSGFRPTKSLCDLRNPISYITHTIKYCPDMIFNSAFNWDNTKNIKRERWYELHLEWYRYCRNILIKNDCDER